MISAFTRTASRLALLAAFAATPAFAQDVAETSDEVVVTAQRENQTQVLREGNVGVLGNKPAEDVPFAIKSYNSTLILNQQPQTLGELLQNDPSIRTSLGFGIAAEVFIIRGFPLGGEDIALDGLYGITPRQLIAPELYEQVQVLGGASAFLNGAAPGGGGLGGGINLQLKRADDRPLTRVTGNFSSRSHFGGAFDVGRRFGANDEFGVRINGAYRSGDTAIDDEFRRSVVLGAGFDWRGERARLFVDLAYQRIESRQTRMKVRLGAGITDVPDVPEADANYYQPWGYLKLRDVFGVVRGEFDVADNATLYASFGARDGSEESISDGITLVNATTGAATGSALFVPRTDNNEAATAGLRVALNGFGMSHEINFGGSYTRQINRNAYDFFDGFATNLYDTPTVPLPPSTVAVWNPAGDQDNPGPVSRLQLYSAFVSDTIGLFDDRVLITGGLRMQDMRVLGYATATNIEASRYTESAITPVVGLVVKPIDGLSLYANRIEGLQQGPSAPFDPLLVNSGEVFAPSKTTQYEVGAKLSFGRFNASLAAFQTDQPATGSVPSAFPGLSRFEVIGKQRHKGLEFSLDGEVVEGLRVIAGASLTDAKLRDTLANDGQTARGVPKYTANANVEWDLPFLQGLTLTGRVIHTGEQEVTIPNSFALESWTKFDLGARYVAAFGTTPVTLRVNVDNVANKRYWASAYDAFATALLQGAPRTAKASITIDF